MNRLALLIFLVNACTNVVAAADRRIAFERQGGIYIANLEGTLIRKLADGIFPAVSPDATRVVFTTNAASARTSPGRLAIIEIASGERNLFIGIPGENCSHPAWSPDGKMIAFTVRTDATWNIGMVKADGTEFKLISKNDQNARDLYSPCWAGDGKSIFCHDMTNIYQLGLDGSILAQWRIDRIVPNGSMSADGRIDVSPGGQRLLLSVDMNEETDRADWDGPVPALWSFDVSRQAAVRSTTMKLFAWDGCWLDDANILLVSQKAGETQAALYRTDGTHLKRLIDDCRRPSVSRP